LKHRLDRWCRKSGKAFKFRKWLGVWQQDPAAPHRGSATGIPSYAQPPTCLQFLYARFAFKKQLKETGHAAVFQIPFWPGGAGPHSRRSGGPGVARYRSGPQAPGRWLHQADQDADPADRVLRGCARHRRHGGLEARGPGGHQVADLLRGGDHRGAGAGAGAGLHLRAGRGHECGPQGAGPQGHGRLCGERGQADGRGVHRLFAQADTQHGGQRVCQWRRAAGAAVLHRVRLCAGDAG